jgi:hypothetical protein
MGYAQTDPWIVPIIMLLVKVAKVPRIRIDTGHTQTKCQPILFEKINRWRDSALKVDWRH